MAGTDAQFNGPLGAAVVTAIMQREGKKTGKEIRFSCPSHDDEHPSARYHVDKQTWYCDACKAGGGIVDLARKLGIETKTSAAKSKASEGHVVATYDYTDAEGQLLFQTVRKAEPKDFYQQRPDGKGGWILNLNGVEPVPYRLSNVLFAGKDEPVFVVEGEKDVDNLIACGLVATTNHGGAGKWKDAHSQHLKGRQVVLLPDNDESGRKHVQVAGRSLKAAGVVSLKMLELPGLGHKQDVSDWLTMGHTVQELLTLVKEAPAWEPPADLFDVLGDSPTKPVMERAGLGYLFRYPQHNINLLLEQIHGGRDGLVATILVTGEVPLAPSRLHWGKITLASPTSRKTAITDLEKKTEGSGIKWGEIIEDACYQVAMEERRGEPFLQLGNLPTSSRSRWLIENLAPLLQPTTIFGPGGGGKSRFVAAMAVSVEAGVVIVPGFTPQIQGRTLYLDWETDGEEIQQRVREICAGAGIEAVYPLYRRCTGALTDQIEEVLRVVQQHDVQLVVIDSVEAATAAAREYGADANDVTVRMHQALRLLGVTSILIDHLATSTIADSKAPRKAYGSIFKMNYARMAFELKSVVNGPGRITLGLYNVKRNNGGLPLKPKAISVEFIENEWTKYDRGAMDDPDLMEGMDAIDKIATVLKGVPCKHYKEIATETGLTEGTVKVKLSKGKKDRSLFIDLGDGRWALVDKRYEASEDQPF